MKRIGLLLLSLTLAACNGGDDTSATSDTPEDSTPTLEEGDLTSRTLVNSSAYIPSQCYTKTTGTGDKVHNPCYSCHIASLAPNYINDPDIQLAYAFPESAVTNPWTNLFVDRSAQVAAISDSQILEYIRESNYFDANGAITLRSKLQNLPTIWDYDKDGAWSGYTPDCYYNFDGLGLDLDPQGQDTWWRSYAYAPFLGTFWPTNGSSNDVLIRLAEPFRQTQGGVVSREVYIVNLAIVEAMIRREDVPIEVVDENLYGVDLNRNDVLDMADTVVYQWIPEAGLNMSYVGKAKDELEAGNLHIAGGLFPEGTEFLHSVRYVNLLEDENLVQLAPRMKELRYAVKETWYGYPDLFEAAQEEIKDKDAFPDRLRTVLGNMEDGVSNGQGWVYQGFIEDEDGNLRPQTYEENVFCIGCHSGVGATADGVFSFQRKLSAVDAAGNDRYRKGWYHWTQKGMQGTPEPVREDGNGEYSYYLTNNHAGDEFRENTEVMEKFFDADGNPLAEPFAKLKDDMSYLLFPSHARALQLNKAYKVIVEEQSFIHGRDATIVPASNVNTEVEVDEPTGIETAIAGPGILH